MHHGRRQQELGRHSAAVACLVEAAGASRRGSFMPPPPSQAEGGRSRAKLKPLHWDKVTPHNPEHSMVWDKISDGSFRIDDELMDTLFGYGSTNQNNPNSNKTPSNPFTSPSTSSNTPTQICLLDPRKSQNIAIVIRSLGISRQEILDALFNGRDLSHDALEKLSRIALTKEEETMIREFSGNPTRLADAESFLYHLTKAVPSPFARIDAMLFKFNYDMEILHIKKSIQALELACRELKSHGLFLKLLEAILKAGNRMNAGTARGNAKAFNLAALCKLSDVKSTDGKTTLLHFVVEEVVRSEGKRLVINRNHSLRRSGSSSSNNSGNLANSAGQLKTTREEKEREYIKLGLPVVGGLSEELANVKKAAAVDYEGLASSCSSIGTRISEIRQFFSKGNGGDAFLREMKGFLEASEEELRVVVEEQVRAMELVKRTTEYYQPGGSRDRNAQPLQLFVIVRDFIVMFDRVCVDITRNMQKRPLAGRSSPQKKAETEKRAAAMFPNLPPRFMSENSRSSSDSDSEDGF
ncbi:uncharacterized protein A4U43_C05F23450 [Asparagus officinalis]|uniref:Formin-like protein n=2 Tax=Asparagus officinalis TaxID=4686 RepID=A0A5P1EU32_ASPOF|nr:uncharacterized protein A4U43_C05F23450 [Asparagus officinalis]